MSEITGSPGQILVGLALAAALLGGEAWAAPPARRASRSAGVEAEARPHLIRAGQLYRNNECPAALEEYREVLALMKSKGAMRGIALCLSQLGQYDEALDKYEELRREFPVLPPDDEANVAHEMLDLADKVGMVTVTGDTPAGASIFVDDRLRGRLPLEKPLRVAVGSHNVRVEKEGFIPIEGAVKVKAGQDNVAQLSAKSRKGRLRVSEKHNWSLYVEVDGKDVGVSPWQGLFDPGEHRVRLHGFVSVESLAQCEVPPVLPGEVAMAAQEGAKLESTVAPALVRLYEETTVVLGAEELDASLHVGSAPEGATLKIDAREVGSTPWEGRLLLGEHAIELSAGGFVTARQTVRLEKRKQRELSVLLEREPDPAAGLRAARSGGAGVAFGVGLVGFGVFGVTGALALVKRNEIRSTCGGYSCPAADAVNLDAARSLGTASTVGLVVGAVGAATGTVVLLAVRPKAHRTGGPAWRAGVGAGRFEIGGQL